MQVWLTLALANVRFVEQIFVMRIQHQSVVVADRIGYQYLISPNIAQGGFR